LPHPGRRTPGEEQGGSLNRSRFIVFLAVVWEAAAIPAAWSQQTGQGDAPAAADARLLRLKEQAERNPANRRLLYDYMNALGEAGRDAEMLALLPRLDLASAPVNVLARAGRAASNLKRFDLAVEVYRAALPRAPARTDVVAGLAYSLIDSGKPEEAIALLEERRQSTWQQIPLLEAYAEALRARRDDAQALLVHERILALDPKNREAQRNRVFTLARLGAPHRALELTAQTPGLLSEDELFTLQGDRAAITTRWGAAADATAPDRFASTDAALAENERLLQQLHASGKAGSAAERRLLFDRIEALRNRVRMAEAVAVYERLVAEGAKVPPHAQLAAADAYLYLEQPEKARDLYLQALPEVDDSFAARIQLFYAYDDAGQHREALAHIDRVVATTPQRTGAGSPLTVADNPDYASALATAGAARGYQDRLAEAQQRLESFRALAPFNMEAREKLAVVYGARGWPRKAEQAHLWILAAEPDNREARVGHADNLRDLQEWRAAEREAEALADQFPEDRQVQRVARRWRIHERPELRVDAGAGTSSSGAGPVGTRERALETWLLSAPIRYDWRAFAHQYDSSADFPQGKAHRRRIGAGMEYRVRDLRLTGEINESYDDTSDIGLSLTGQWWASDQWIFDAAVHTSTNDIPLQARLSDVEGESLGAGVTYRVSESRRFGAAFQTIDFSDGNRRNILTASAFQRFVTGPVYKLDGVAALYTSSNSLDNAPYFNPEDDFGLDATLIGEQRLWRRYDRSFAHRLHLTLGRYRQSGFGADRTAAIRYEHAWALDERLFLLYGAQRTSHPYDGERVYADYYDLSLEWRF
jgi:biofilm PGA synthesis protein PgaA